MRVYKWVSAASVGLTVIAVGAPVAAQTAVALINRRSAPVPRVVLAQTRPDFSGVWVAVGPTFNDFENLEVQQHGSTLIETRSLAGKNRAITYQLDATETRAAHDNGAVTLASARWDRGALVLTTVTTSVAGHQLTIRQVWSLNANMQLVVEMRRTDSSGKTPPETIKVVYERR